MSQKFFTFFSAVLVTCFSFSTFATHEISEENSIDNPSLSYAINLVWIMKETDIESAESIIPHDKQEECFRHLEGWSQLNPKASIFLWYDEKYVTDNLVDATREHIKEFTNVELRNIRTDLDVVRKNEKAFSLPVPTYTRADIIDILANLKVLEEGYDIATCPDFDMPPISREELLDPDTIQALKDYGFVMSEGGHLGFENNFQMFSKDKPSLIKALHDIQIDFSLERINSLLKRGRRLGLEGERQKAYYKFLEDIVYDTYIQMFLYFLHCEGTITLKTNSGEEYIYEEHGITPFREIYPKVDGFNFDHQAIPFNGKGNPVLPMKSINIPPPSLEYGE